MVRGHFTAAKRRNVTMLPLYCYITAITLIMRVAGLEEVVIGQRIIAVVECGCAETFFLLLSRKLSKLLGSGYVVCVTGLAHLSRNR